MPTANELLRDSTLRHSVNLHRLSNGIAARILATLQQAEEELERQLRRRLTEWSRTRTEAALAEVRDLLRQTYRAIGMSLRTDLSELAAYESDFQRAMLARAGNAVAVGLGSGLTLEQLAVIVNSRPFQGRLLRTWAAGLELDAFRRVKGAIRQAMTLGETIDQAIRRIRGTRANKYRDGILAISRRDAEAVARTALAHVAESVSDATYAANADVLRGLKFLATLDSRTTIQWCVPRDGHVYSVIGHRPLDGGPPWLAGPGRLHWRCRSTSTPVLKSARELGIDDAGTRSSMTGQVPASLNYREWLKTQPASVQDSVLGKRRGLLFRSGKIESDDLFTVSGRFKSVAELRAFEDAA